MRKLLLLVVLGVAGIGGYYLIHGRVPWVALSVEEVRIAELSEELGVIRQQWKQAGRAGALGVETSSITDGPVERLQRLDASLAALLPGLKTAEGRKQAELLRREIAVFKSEMRQPKQIAAIRVMSVFS